MSKGSRRKKTIGRPGLPLPVGQAEAAPGNARGDGVDDSNSGALARPPNATSEDTLGPPVDPKGADPTRRDLLGFLDSLYAGAVALGIARFLDYYDQLTDPSNQAKKLFVQLQGEAQQLLDKLKGLALPPADPVPHVQTLAVPSSLEKWLPVLVIVKLVTALIYILDDWRHARSVNFDYGFRLNRRSPAYRFWIDSGIAIAGYFAISYSFVSPVRFLIFLGIGLLLGALWSASLHKEIRWFLDTRKEFPENSLGLSRSEAMKLYGEDHAYACRADYRTRFVERSHWVTGGLALGFAGCLFLLRRHLKDLEYAPLIRVLPDPWSSREIRNALDFSALGLGTVAPVAGIILLKVFHRRRRAAWIARLERICGRQLCE